MSLLLLALVWLGTSANAQINTGSDGHDGAFNPTVNTVINMANHPDGIYQYTSVNIPSGIVVQFVPNANNTPVVWLVQGSCVINGTVDLSGKYGTGGSNGGVAGIGGPGGFSGGRPGSPGQGPGGGSWDGPFYRNGYSYDPGSFASYGNTGSVASCFFYCCVQPGPVYGNSFIVPLLGGSGGGGIYDPAYSVYSAGGGGGGAILVAASNQIQVNGVVTATGGHALFVSNGNHFGGAGSGGAVRFVTARLVGSGSIDVSGGSETVPWWTGGSTVLNGGAGRIRLDVFENAFGGATKGVTTQGFQPIILPAAGQGAQLNIASVAGNQVAASPTGQLATPDVIIPAQQANPIPIVVNCANVPLNTSITVTVKPMNGPAVSAVSQNNAGTLASSTATVSLNLPRGGGLIYATATLPVGPAHGASVDSGGRNASYAQTGLTTGGERFAKMEIKATLGGRQEVAYITESGKRFALPAQERQ